MSSTHTHTLTHIHTSTRTHTRTYIHPCFFTCKICDMALEKNKNWQQCNECNFCCMIFSVPTDIITLPFRLCWKCGEHLKNKNNTNKPHTKISPFEITEQPKIQNI